MHNFLFLPTDMHDDSKITFLLGNLLDLWSLTNFCAGNDGTIIAKFEGPGFNDKFALKYGVYL